MRARTGVVYLLAALGLGVGCEVIAGLQDRQLVDGGTDAAPEVGPCSSPKTACAAGDASVCADLSKDIGHCGTCTKACPLADAGPFDATSGNPDPGIPTFDAAADAAYVSVPGPSCDAGTCDFVCAAANAKLCGSLCYDTQNVHDHCGGCATACIATDWCHGGQCCPTGQETCGDAGCVDVLSDNGNCGGCGVQCSGATVCSGGFCVLPVTFSDTFVGTATPTTQCSDWNNFRAQLTGSYTSINIHSSGDPTGHTCTGAAANTLCQALHNATATGAIGCGGNTWSVSVTCDSAPELNAGTGTVCACETPGYDVRPCQLNANWGGVGTATCGAPTQTITVTCQ